MADIHVSDIIGPHKELCWLQDPDTMVRCDRAAGHLGLHSWEMAAEIERAEARWMNLQSFIIENTPAGGPGPSSDAILALMEDMEANHE